MTEDPTLAVPLQDSVTLARLAEAEGELSGLADRRCSCGAR